MSRMAEQQLYIHGGYTSATSGRTFETINPANGNVLATVQAAGREDVDRAVKSAQQGQKIWAAMTAMERSRILRRAVDILRERNDELAKLETLDTGKAYSETSTVDIVTGADVLEYYAGLIPALEGSQIPLRETSFVYTRREPLGVVAGIGAWNYPIQIALWKSAPALAAGNAMIFKPSEVTPLTALKRAEVSLRIENVARANALNARQNLLFKCGFAFRRNEDASAVGTHLTGAEEIRHHGDIGGEIEIRIVENDQR